jgi:putative ABC transport system permease protein
MSGFLGELRQVLRSLARAPELSIAAVLTLAVGAGACTAMLSATYLLLLRPLPFPSAGRLVALFATHGPQGEAAAQPVSLLDVRDWQAAAHSFTAIAASRTRTMALGDQVVLAGQTTAELTAVFGVGPRLGRSFTRQEADQGAHVALVSDALWRRRLGASPAAVGRPLRLNDDPYVVVGVLPADFHVEVQGREPDLYIPLDPRAYGGSRSVRSLAAVARLRPGVSAAQARSELATLAGRLALAHPDTNAHVGAGLVDLHRAWRGDSERPLLLLAAAGVVLLLIAGVNVANLLVARLAARHGELAVRAALGAGAAALGRGMLLEAVLLAVCGAAVGLVAAGWFLRLLPLALQLAGAVPASPSSAAASGGAAGAGAALPALPAGAADLGPTALAIAAVVAVVLGLALGLVVVAVARRQTLQRRLQDHRQAGASRSRLRDLLVIAQLALSMVLLTSAGLLLRSFLILLTADPGFHAGRVVKFGIGLPDQRYGADAQQIVFHERLLDALSRLPDIEAVGVVARLPVSGAGFKTSFEIAGAPLPPETRPHTAINLASPGYFRALRIPLLAGRAFSRFDTVDAPRVILVNRTFAERFFPGRGPLGRQLTLGWTSDLNPPTTAWTIVGVVGDTRQRSLEAAIEPEVDLPVSQYPLDGGAYTLLTSRSATDLQPAVEEEVRRLDAHLERPRLRPMQEVVRESLGDRRLALLLLALFAATALALTGVGLYGVVAGGVARRRREIAIRMALGARPQTVVEMVLGHGVRLSLVGLLVGALAFLAGGRLLQSHLYGVGTADPWTALGVAALLFATALAGCAWPARAAARTDPTTLLRE